MLREPLFHFLIAGALLFILYSYWGATSETDKAQITVSSGQIERLKELIIQNRYCDVRELRDKIISAVKEYTQGEPQSDDMTLMVLRVPSIL